MRPERDRPTVAVDGRVLNGEYAQAPRLPPGAVMLRPSISARRTLIPLLCRQPLEVLEDASDDLLPARVPPCRRVGKQSDQVARLFRSVGPGRRRRREEKLLE